jgi:conjugal transfer/entry exclusion protein
MNAGRLLAMLQNSTRRRFTRGLLIVGLCGLAGQAGAQWVVTDPAHTALTYAGWIKELISQGEQYAQQIEQYRTQVQQYQTQLRQYEQQYVKGGIFNQGALATHQFAPRALDAGMSERCPSGLRSLLASSASAENCAAIVQTENARYNAIVSVLTVSKERDAELQKIYAERGGISEQDAGALQANNNRLLALQSRMQMDIQQARSQTEGYDRYLELLRGDQQMIANQALEGDDLLGATERGAALRAALNAARRSDR